MIQPPTETLDSRLRGKDEDDALDSRLRGKDEDDALDSRLRGKDEDDALDSRLRGKDEDDTLDSRLRGKDEEFHQGRQRFHRSPDCPVNPCSPDRSSRTVLDILLPRVKLAA